MNPSAADQLAALDDVAAVLAEGQDRAALYRAVEQALQRLLGHRLFTLMAVLPDGMELQRFWTSDERAYPLSGRKRVSPTPWGELVLKGRNPWLGRDRESLRWAFSDHAKLVGLGLGSAITVPVVRHERLLGTLNILHSENHFVQDDVAVTKRFAPYLVSAVSDEVDIIGMV